VKDTLLNKEHRSRDGQLGPCDPARPTKSRGLAPDTSAFAREGIVEADHARG
jgi:hypothetical protein